MAVEYTMQTLSVILEFVGTLMVGMAVLRVHMHMKKEHKIDDDVIRTIKRERKITILGLVLITIGFILAFF